MSSNSTKMYRPAPAMPYAPDDYARLEPEAFPALIYEAERELQRIDADIAGHRERIAEIELYLEAKAADKEQHPDLTNATLRSAWVTDQKYADSEYVDASAALSNLLAKKLERRAYAALLADAFRVSRARYERETTILALGLTPDRTGHAPAAE